MIICSGLERVVVQSRNSYIEHKTIYKKGGDGDGTESEYGTICSY